MKLTQKYLSSFRKARAYHGVSFRCLSDRSGVSYPHLCRIFNGKASPTLDVVEKIAKALKIKIHVSSNR